MRRFAAGALPLVLAVGPTGSSYREPTMNAADMNTRTGQIAGLGGFDAGRTARLQDGRWLMLTGDATQTDEQVWPVYHNAAVIWDGAGQRRVESPHPGGHFFPDFEDGSRFWPLSFFITAGRAYVLGTRVAPTGDMQWTGLGGYGAVVNVPAGGDPRWVRYFPTPSGMLGDDAVQWFGAIAYDGTHVYVHGTRDRAEAWHARDGGYVARVPLAQLEVPHRWQVWTGQSWSPDVAQAVPTIPIGQLYTTGLNGTANAYTLHRRPNGQWAVTTKRAGDASSELGRYVAATPWGPWSWEPLLTVCDTACYLAGAAPTIPTVSGQLLVQWSRRGSTPYWAEVPQ
ncbi:hypothetical protein [Micromonospora sp. L32]|uniref:hypothetical protein n=1 Tax=Micromonospora sp. L32 TaxID=3452214 RepID=UPI003F8AF3A3